MIILTQINIIMDKEQKIKICKRTGRVILFIFLAILSIPIFLIYNLEVVENITTNIVLPFGWPNDCSGERYGGFPFSSINHVPPTILCADSLNPIALILNSLFLILMCYVLYKFLLISYRKIIKK